MGRFKTHETWNERSSGHNGTIDQRRMPDIASYAGVWSDVSGVSMVDTWHMIAHEQDGNFHVFSAVIFHTYLTNRIIVSGAPNLSGNG